MSTVGEVQVVLESASLRKSRQLEASDFPIARLADQLKQKRRFGVRGEGERLARCFAGRLSGQDLSLVQNGIPELASRMEVDVVDVEGLVVRRGTAIVLGDADIDDIGGDVQLFKIVSYVFPELLTRSCRGPLAQM